jgi:hypothetical protein
MPITQGGLTDQITQWCSKNRLTMCPEIKKSINNVCAIALSDEITNTYYIFLVLAPVRTKNTNL